MRILEHIMPVLEILGTISFALSGAMTAIQKKADLFGVVFLGATTAVGGGILRDVLLGKVPPTAFVQKHYVLMALAASLLLFIIVSLFRERYTRQEGHINEVNNIFDALGLGIFSVVGVQAAQAAGEGSNLFLCLFLALITGVGGGLMRDLMLQSIPFVLTKRIYAVAALLGGLCYWVMTAFRPEEVLFSSILSVILVFLVRMLATQFHWDLPRAL